MVVNATEAAVALEEPVQLDFQEAVHDPALQRRPDRGARRVAQCDQLAEQLLGRPLVLVLRGGGGGGGGVREHSLGTRNHRVHRASQARRADVGAGRPTRAIRADGFSVDRLDHPGLASATWTAYARDRSRWLMWPSRRQRTVQVSAARSFRSAHVAGVRRTTTGTWTGPAPDRHNKLGWMVIGTTSFSRPMLYPALGVRRTGTVVVNGHGLKRLQAQVGGRVVKLTRDAANVNHAVLQPPFLRQRTGPIRQESSAHSPIIASSLHG